MLLSCVWWFMIGGSMAILALAFDLNTGFFGGCFIAALVALAVALPQAPGFLGVFPMAAKLGLKLMGLGGGAASGYALVLWLMSVLPVAVMGMACTWREGLSVGQIAGGRAGAAGDEAPGTSPPGTSPPP